MSFRLTGTLDLATGSWLGFWHEEGAGAQGKAHSPRGGAAAPAQFAFQYQRVTADGDDAHDDDAQADAAGACRQS